MLVLTQNTGLTHCILKTVLALLSRGHLKHSSRTTLPSTFPDHQNRTFSRAVIPPPPCQLPPAYLTSIHSSWALSPKTGPSQNQICKPFLCYKTLNILGTQLLKSKKKIMKVKKEIKKKNQKI